MEKITHIIIGCKEKNIFSQKVFYEKYYGLALKTVFRYIYRYEKAVDVVNDGFVKVFRNFENFTKVAEEDTEKVVIGWLKKIMINTAIDELRKNKMMPEIGGIPEYVWESSDNLFDADQLQLYKELIILIKELPPAYRTVFNLFVIEGYNHYEIAYLMKIPVGTSKSNLSRARQLLQIRIKESEQINYAEAK